jgi:hypothetical protein
VRLRVSLLAAALAAAVLPALAHGDPADCLVPDPEAALCAATEAGQAAQQAEQPLIPARDAARLAADQALEAAGICNPLDHAACLLPFPNDDYTKADPTTATGRRIDISPLAMPRNAANRPMDPTELNRNDGWSPGTPILTVVPGLSTSRTGIASEANPGDSLRHDAPVVLLDATTGKRWPYTAELDTNPTDGEQPLLIVRPAINLAEGHRYVVGLRNLKDASGKTIAAGPEFAALRAKATAGDPVFGPLLKARVPAKDLFLAWGFTVASTRNTTERMLHIRDDAFASLNGGAPTFTVDTVTANYSDKVATRVQGTFQVHRDLHLRHPQVRVGSPPRPRLDLRPRAARRPGRGRCRQRPEDGQRERRPVLRHRLVRHGDR